MDKSDAKLQEAITLALQTQLNLSSDSVNVEVRKGFVEITGMVDVLAEKLEAEKIIREITGQKKIGNALTVAMDNQISDRKLREAVEDEMISSGCNVKHIGVSVESGIVYLIGKADSVAEERLAIKAAQGVRSVKEVISKVEVAEINPQDDASITNEVELLFTRDTLLDNEEILTVTRGGVVTLKGWVENVEQYEHAENLASQANGVREVHNGLGIRQYTRSQEVALTREIREELGAEGLLDVKVFVTKDIAFLAGRVASIDQKRKAEEIVRSFRDVEGVANDIHIYLH